MFGVGRRRLNQILHTTSAVATVVLFWFVLFPMIIMAMITTTIVIFCFVTLYLLMIFLDKKVAHIVCHIVFVDDISSIKGGSYCFSYCIR